MACTFNPPVTGREVHDERGVYPLLTEDAAPAAADPTTDETQEARA